MADIICVIGNKGGTGKTTLSHMLCQGLGQLGQRSVCVLTDTYREPLDPAGRNYLIADARSPAALVKVVDKIRALPAWMGVIDGGGNRTEMDHRLYQVADLVLLPFRDSHEDIRTVIRDLEMFPHAYAVPNQWPSWYRDAADATVRDLLGPYMDRILDPIFAHTSTKLLLQKQAPAQLPNALTSLCMSTARQVVDLLQISIAAPAAPKTSTQATPSAPPQRKPLAAAA